MTVFATQPIFADEIVLSASETESTAGYFSLSWKSPDNNNEFVLTQSDNPRSSDADSIKWTLSNIDSFSISGLSSGVYYYRIAALDKPQSWSNTVRVDVKHHSLDKALMMFALGATLFSLLTIIIFLNKNKNNGL